MSMKKGVPEFGAVTNFKGDEATIALRGTTENRTAFDLGAVLDAAIDRQPASLVLDVTELDYLGPGELLAVSNAEKRLATLGVALTLRSSSAVVNRLLGVIDAAEPKGLDGALAEHGHLGPEQLGGTNALSHRFAPNLSADDLRRVTALPTDPDVIDGALRLIVELARISVRGADGVSVSRSGPQRALL